MLRMFALTGTIITTVIGPACCLYWRLSHHEYRTEDDVADLAYRLGRAEADVASMSLTLHALLGSEAKAVGWLPPPPAGPLPPLYLVRDEARRPERN